MKDQSSANALDDGRLTASSKFIEIVFDNIKDQFGGNLAIIRECHRIAKDSQLLTPEIKESIAAFYRHLKFSEQGVKQYFSDKIVGNEDN